MRGKLFLVGLIFSIVAVTARPDFRKSFYDKHLGEPTVHENGTLSLHNRVEFDNERFIELHYTAEMHDNPTHNLDEHEKIHRVACGSGFVNVHFTSEQHAQAYKEEWVAGTILTGGREWGCVDEHHNWPVHLLRRIETVHTHPKDPKVLHIKTGEKISHAHAFKNLDLHFKTNSCPQDAFSNIHVDKNKKSAGASHLRSANKRDLEGFVPESTDDQRYAGETDFDAIYETDQLLEDTKAVFTAAETALSTLAEFLKGIDISTDGITLEYEKHDRLFDENFADMLAMQFNYDRSRGRREEVIPLGDYLNCTDCYYFLLPVIDVVVRIENFRLKALEVIIDGTLQVKIEVNLVINETRTFSNSTQFGTDIQLPRLHFSIGSIPVVIDPTVKVMVGYLASVNVQAGATAGFVFSAYTQFGFIFNENQREFVGKSRIYPPEAGVSFTNPQIDADLVTFVEPRLYFRIDFMGGPFLSLKPYIQTVLQTAGEDCSDNFPDSNFQTGINFGVQLGIGAFVELTNPADDDVFFEQEWDPVVVYQLHEPILAACVVFNLSAVAAKDPQPPEFMGDPLLRGTSWSTVNTEAENLQPSDPECALFEDPDLNAQYSGEMQCLWSVANSECSSFLYPRLDGLCKTFGSQSACEAAVFHIFFASLTYVTSEMDCQATMLYYSDDPPTKTDPLDLTFGAFLYPEKGIIEKVTSDNVTDDSYLCLGGFPSIPTLDFTGNFVDGNFNELNLNSERGCFSYKLKGTFGTTTLVVGLSSASHLTNWIYRFFAIVSLWI